MARLRKRFRIISVSVVVANAGVALFPHVATADWAEVRQRVRGSVLFIEAIRENKDGTNREVFWSSGFVISQNGYGLTVSHALPKATAETSVKYQASVASRHGHKFPVEIIRRDDDVDVALIAFPKVQNWIPMTLAESKVVPEDARLYVLGFPRTSDLASAEGLLSSHFGPGGKWQTTLPLDYGNSGGPVFDIGGRVIGIAAGGLDEARAITFVIPSDYVKPLHSMVAFLPESLSGAMATASATFQMPFSVTVDHQERRQVREEFCFSGMAKVGSAKFHPISQGGTETRVISVAPLPDRENCVEIRAFVAGNGVDRIGPVIVNNKGRGWLTGTVVAE